MRIPGWESSTQTKALREQISVYVEKIVSQEIPRIPFNGYQEYRKTGSRKEFEDAYFEVRKQLTALGLYLQWNAPSQKEGVFHKERVFNKERSYFNELLWSVANEFSWCLGAHLSYGEQGFLGEPSKQIDLFSSETAATLAEILILHPDKIDPYIQRYIRSQINDRVLTPFLEKDWGWETSKNNWCAVCSGSVGMAALLLETGEKRKQILDKVERALVYYLQCFGEDGATEEGIGYWAYGFGYYIYYTAMRLELDSEYKLSDAIRNKVKKIAEFPQLVQMTKVSFVPFSDSSTDTLIPTGLISYLQQEYGAVPPVCTAITPFDFDHCYRFAHISRNLWWTRKEIFGQPRSNIATYFQDKQWLIQRKDACFVAVKGGNNKEEHNHNDVGSFLLALDGELLLADLGAGPYTADYFGEKRYQYPHTRSLWHNLPLLQGKEQVPTATMCIVEDVRVQKAPTEVEKVEETNITGAEVSIRMELSGLYELPELNSFHRVLESDMIDCTIRLKDSFLAKEKIAIEEGFVSVVKPTEINEGVIQWRGKNGQVSLYYDSLSMDYIVEEKELGNHRNEKYIVYRLGLRVKDKVDECEIALKFIYELKN